MKIIGLTGPSGSGKTTVALIAKELGFAVIDCDKLARKVTEKGSNTLSVLSSEFGEDIILSDGTLDRKRLAEKAFQNKEKTERLNSIMLPAVAKLVKVEIEKCKSEGFRLVLLDAPTLYESGLDGICSNVLAVLCPIEIRKQRIIERDGLTEEQASVRLAASKPNDFYRERTEFVIINDGDFAEFRNSARRILNTLGD